MNGVPSYNLPSVARNYQSDPLTAAERVRFTYGLVTAPSVDQGLGISTNVAGWSRVKEILSLHDNAFNEKWIQSWTKRNLGLTFSDHELDEVKNQVSARTQYPLPHANIKS